MCLGCNADFVIQVTVSSVACSRFLRREPVFCCRPAKDTKLPTPVHHTSTEMNVSWTPTRSERSFYSTKFTQSLSTDRRHWVDTYSKHNIEMKARDQFTNPSSSSAYSWISPCGPPSGNRSTIATEGGSVCCKLFTAAETDENFNLLKLCHWLQFNSNISKCKVQLRNETLSSQMVRECHNNCVNGKMLLRKSGI